MEHPQPIVCVKSALFDKRKNGFSDYEIQGGDIIIAQRELLEKDDTYRQVLPECVFVHNGKVWAYERTEAGGEANLHGKTAVAVGGHWDLEDLVSNNSVIDLAASFEKAMNREIEEEVSLTSNIIKKRKLEKVICADDTFVDRHHVAVIYICELDGEGISANEDQLKELGFIDPQELLDGDYNNEVWTRMICEILVNEKQ